MLSPFFMPFLVCIEWPNIWKTIHFTAKYMHHLFFVTSQSWWWNRVFKIANCKMLSLHCTTKIRLFCGRKTVWPDKEKNEDCAEDWGEPQPQRLLQQISTIQRTFRRRLGEEDEAFFTAAIDWDSSRPNISSTVFSEKSKDLSLCVHEQQERIV